MLKGIFHFSVHQLNAGFEASGPFSCELQYGQDTNNNKPK